MENSTQDAPKKRHQGKRCSVGNCPNNGSNSTCSFFRFPRDESVRKKWISFCRRADKINPDSARICSAHFAATDFLRGGSKTGIIPGRLPTIFSHLPPTPNPAAELREQRRLRRNRAVPRKIETAATGDIGTNLEQSPNQQDGNLDTQLEWETDECQGRRRRNAFQSGLICSVCESDMSVVQNCCCLRGCSWFRDKEFSQSSATTAQCSCSVDSVENVPVDENEFPAARQRNVCSHRMSTASLPEFLDFFWSQDGLRVKSRMGVKKTSVFGPLVAPLIPRLPKSESPDLLLPKYWVGIRNVGKFYHLLESDSECNWMKYVRLVDNYLDANLLAFQFSGHVYFVAMDDIRHDDELVVAYAANSVPPPEELEDPGLEPSSGVHSPTSTDTLPERPQIAKPKKPVIANTKRLSAADARKRILPYSITRVEKGVSADDARKRMPPIPSSSAPRVERFVVQKQNPKPKQNTNGASAAADPFLSAVLNSFSITDPQNGSSSVPKTAKARTCPIPRNSRKDKLTEKEGFFKCRICLRSFLTAEILSDHYDEMHPDELKVKEPFLNLPVKKVPYYACIVCKLEKKFDTLRHAVFHVDRSHTEQETSRAKKYAIFAKKYTEHDGRVMKAEQDVYRCAVCGLELLAARLFLQHVKSRHPEYHALLMPDAPEDVQYDLPRKKPCYLAL